MSSSKEKARSPVAPGELVAGKYRVERVIGSGGMGVVVAATHVELEQKVALKFLHAHILDGESGAERFSREARAAVRLKSEHVARVYDVGVLPSGAPFSVMELLEGDDAALYAAAHAPLPIHEAAEIVLQACEAIVEAHAAGIVHRDLKPQNLFVTKKSNGALLVKVLDFGVSKWVGGTGEDLSLTDSSVVVGSPLYMAPEQMRAARNAEPRSDIWALGVILYELCAGKVPFDGATVTELCLKVVTDAPAPLINFRPEIPADLVRIVTRCLEKDLEKRFENVAMLARALEPFASSAGATRGWRSMVETGDSLDVGNLPTETAPDSRRANLPKRRTFAKGAVVGAALTAIGVVVGALAWSSRTQSGGEAHASSTSGAAPVSVPSTSTIATGSSTSTIAAVDSSAMTAPATSATPVNSALFMRPRGSESAANRTKPGAATSASTNAIVPPNGAPILH